MNQKKLLTFGLFVLVGLTLVGCGGSGTQPTAEEADKTKQVVVDTGRPLRPEGGLGGSRGAGGGQPQPVDIEKNKEYIAAREEEAQQAEIKIDDNGNTQTISASEVIYPAKVGDTIEAHPAWLTVTVTLDGDTITGLDIEQESSSPKSARHQAQFAEQIQGKVIGKKLSESNSIYISAASSTSTAFNSSINEIQELYEQSQL